MAALAATTTTTQTLGGRCCFRCGLPGHTDKTCPNDPNPELGRAAWERYKAWRPTGARPVPAPRNRFEDLRDWLRPFATPGAAVDPVLETQTKKGQPFSKRAVLDLDAVSGDYFVREVASLVERLQHDFAAHAAGGKRATVGENQTAASAMYQRLAVALRSGEPADFTHLKELLVYTAERLRIRSRYMFALMMAGSALEICSHARRLFLPQAKGECGNTRVVKVLSVGGGPGPSHVAAVLLARFLASVQPRCQREEEQNEDATDRLWAPRVDTVVYDLYADDWRPIIESIAAGLTAGGEGGGHGGNSIRTARCDLRENLDSLVNADMCEATLTADIIVFSFVLHENAAYLRVASSGDGGGDMGHSGSQDRVGGCLVGMLRTAKPGAIIICCDASHHLFPAVLATAKDHGWRVRMGKKVKMGPRSCCFMAKPD